MAASKPSSVRKSLTVSEPTPTIAKPLFVECPQMESIPEKHWSLRDIISEEMARTVQSTHAVNDQQTTASSSR